MNQFFVVRGELAAWALGLDEDEAIGAEDLELDQPVAATVTRRRLKWRIGHEAYRSLGRQAEPMRLPDPLALLLRPQRAE